jgi:hypothetical protein
LIVLRKLTYAVAGLLVPAVMLVPAYGGTNAPPAKGEAPATCAHHGTSVEFVSTPSEAARLAKKGEKLVFVLHVSGYFEDPKLT